MKVFNTLTRKKEEMIPITPGEYKIYCCGPTVYNHIHIGNARPMCVFDTLRRYLEYRGNKVTFVQNFTDIDDKIIRKANEDGTDYKTVSEQFIKEYFTDAEGLNIRPADIQPRATQTMDEIISMVSTLIEKGHAYVVENGDVYFSTKTDKEYGKLSHQPLEDLEAGARINIGELKHDPMDFAIWKASKPGEPAWDSPWGPGRPGWHIECSAMNHKYLGDTIDLHCGGQDLIFPHHENEIAQSECANEAPFANYWMHNGYINVDNVKMSKSLGNFFTVRDVAQEFGYEPIRFLMISSHYRSPINYTCRDSLDFALENADVEDRPVDFERKKQLDSHRAEFNEAMDDDLNTADALAAVFELVRDINTLVLDGKASEGLATFASEEFDELTGVLGLVYNREKEDIDIEIEHKIEERNRARAEKDFATADAIRDELKAQGIILEDTPQGVKWHRE